MIRFGARGFFWQSVRIIWNAPVVPADKEKDSAAASGAVAHATSRMESTFGRRPAAFVKDVQAMRVSLRSMFLGTVCVSLMACAGGCRSGGTGWTTPSWMNWNNWGSGTPASTSLAQNKPGAGPAKPSTQVSPQATASVAAGTGAASGYQGSTN